MIKFLALMFVIVLSLMLLTACGGSRLSGTWESSGGSETWSFSGSRFTFTVRLPQPSYVNPPHNPNTSAEERERIEREGRERVEKQIEAWRENPNYVRTGTYSLSDTEIELTWNGGQVEVTDFSRTENTIVIWGTRFTRQR